jgi:hypothetical protein
MTEEDTGEILRKTPSAGSEMGKKALGNRRHKKIYREASA